MEQRLTVVPQVRHDAAAMRASIQEARRRSCAAHSHRLLRLQRLQLQDSS